MQKKETKDLFIDSSIKKSGILKTLLRGFRHRREEKGDEAPYTYGRPSTPKSPERGRDTGNDMKKVVCL